MQSNLCVAVLTGSRT